MEKDLLTVNNLSVEYMQSQSAVKNSSSTMFRAVDGVSFSVKPGEVLGIVGESGCGKSSLGLSLLRLIPKKQASLSGDILFRNENILTMSEKRLREIRGRSISMILQDLTALNPVFTIGSQFAEALRCHGNVPEREIEARTIKAMEDVNISAPRERMASYPHQLSGGMRQRIAGAIAMACEPDLLIADEPTTALDDTVQAKYLTLLKDIQKKTNVAIIIITHDFGVVASLCDRLCVMYAGQIVEKGSVKDIFNSPSHWYTKGLLSSRPSLSNEVKRLPAISGMPPDLRKPIAGCRFADRCSNVQSVCRDDKPQLKSVQVSVNQSSDSNSQLSASLVDEHNVRCFYPAVVI
ncbi:MAG: ABC transporter ATP-binding protein [Cellvibrionaceae bacterium]